MPADKWGPGAVACGGLGREDLEAGGCAGRVLLAFSAVLLTQKDVMWCISILFTQLGNLVMDAVAFALGVSFSSYCGFVFVPSYMHVLLACVLMARVPSSYGHILSHRCICTVHVLVFMQS